MKKVIYITAAITFGLAINQSFATSFNCNRASTRTENVICQTPQLSKLDSRMNRLYGELRDMATRKGARVLLNSQRSWLDNRDTCGFNANCLVTLYEERIGLFNEVLEN